MLAKSCVGVCAFIFVVLGGAARVEAAPCSDLRNPVYLSAGSIFEPVARTMSPLLAAATGDDQMTPVFIFTQTCDTVRRFSDDSALTGNGRFYGADGTAMQCEIPDGTRADVGIGDLFAASCATLNPAINLSVIRDTTAMVVPMTLAVPTLSDQVAIAAEEGYFAYGFGMAGMVAPWTDETLLFRRTLTSGTQYVISQGIRVPTARWRGVDGMTTQALLMRLATATPPRNALGIAGGNEADANRASVRVLAFRAFGQDHYYWPDSRRSSFDKRNVRDGHYPLWGYQNAFTRTTSPTNGRGQRFVDYLTGARPLPGGDMVDLTVRASFIPQCAMGVQRTADDDGTSFSVYEPAEPCACFFERNVPMGSTTCRTCSTTADCMGSGACRRGFCEAR